MLCRYTCTMQTNWNIFPLQIGKVCSKLINSYLHCDKCGRFNNSLTRKVLCWSHKWNALYMLPHCIPTTYINTVKIQSNIIKSISKHVIMPKYLNQELESFWITRTAMIIKYPFWNIWMCNVLNAKTNFFQCNNEFLSKQCLTMQYEMSTILFPQSRKILKGVIHLMQS